MEKVFELYNESQEGSSINQDSNAREILNFTKSMNHVEYDQNTHTKYYEIIRWAVNHLANVYKNSKYTFYLKSNFDSYINLIHEIKEVKNTNNTFLVKLTGRLLSKIKNRKDLFEKIVNVCKDIITFCETSNNISMKSKILIRLAEIYLINRSLNQSLETIQKAMVDLRRYEDNLGLIEIQLIESKIHYLNKGIAKAKAALTSVKTLITKVYIEPRLQAEIDVHAGTIAAHEKDYNLAYSYFYEAFDVFNLPAVNKTAKALRCIKMMILVKVMNDKLDDVNGIVFGKMGTKYAGRDVEAMKSIEVAVRQKSLQQLKDNINKYEDVLLSEETISYHLSNLINELLEKNLVKIIEPYSVVEIVFIQKHIALSTQEILNKLSQMILDKKINGILDQGRGCLILYEETTSNAYLEKTIDTFKNLDKVVDSLFKKTRMSNLN